MYIPNDQKLKKDHKCYIHTEVHTYQFPQTIDYCFATTELGTKNLYCMLLYSMLQYIR